MTVVHSLDGFFDAIEPWKEAYTNPVVSYVSFSREGKVTALQVRLFLTHDNTFACRPKMATRHLQAHQFSLGDVKLSAREFLDKVIAGKMVTPDGEIDFPKNPSGYYNYYNQPFHEEGLVTSGRLSVLEIFGAPHNIQIFQPANVTHT